MSCGRFRLRQMPCWVHFAGVLGFVARFLLRLQIQMCVLHEPGVWDLAHCLSCPEATSHCIVVVVWMCYCHLFCVY